MHLYELKPDTKNKTGQTWSHTPRREVQGGITCSQLFPERTLTESQIMYLWRWTAETPGHENQPYRIEVLPSLPSRIRITVCLIPMLQNVHTTKTSPAPTQIQVVSVISLNTDTALIRYKLGLCLLEIADSGGLQGVRCRQGPVAVVSASHATAAVSSQTSHSCRTGPLYSHHLCWSEGRKPLWGTLQLPDFL